MLAPAAAYRRVGTCKCARVYDVQSYTLANLHHLPSVNAQTHADDEVARYRYIGSGARTLKPAMRAHRYTKATTGGRFFDFDSHLSASGAVACNWTEDRAVCLEGEAALTSSKPDGSRQPDRGPAVAVS
jgi:hypothetical protein